VVIYHVINKDSHALFKGQGEIGTAVSQKMQSIVDEFSMQYEVSMEYLYDSGSIFDLIHIKAEEVGANMIVLGTHGKKGMQKLFGSYALKVITQAKVPTVVVQNKPFSGSGNILFPINSFTEARQKVSYAKAVASRYNATIHLFMEEVDDVAERNRIEIITKQIIEEFKKSGTPYTLTSSDLDQDSAKDLVRYAVEKNMDMIMVVTEPQIGTSIFNLGPWNERIMFNDAQIPVMCINPVQQGKIYFDL
jgi:hypothetical protein